MNTGSTRGTGTAARSALFAAAMLGTASGGAADSDGWSLELTPYLMLPGVDATLGFDAPNGAPEVDAGPTDVLSLINAVAMLRAEARRGRAFTMIDWMYLDMGAVDSVVRTVEFPDGTVPVGASVTLDTDASFDGFMVMIGGGYRVLEQDHGAADLYGGIRTLNLSTGLRWTLTTSITSPGGGQVFPAAGALETSDETWDAVLGARGAWRLATDWRAFVLADVGRGDGTRSTQWEVGVGWRPGTTSVELAWRDLAFDGLYPSGHGGLRLYGPVLSATFRL